MNLGTIIFQLRKQQQMTQDDFGSLFHVSRQTVSNWENEKSYPDLKTLIHISDHFGISLDILLKEDNIMVKKMDSYRKYKKGFLFFLGLILIIIISVGIYFSYCKYSYSHMYDKILKAGFSKEISEDFIDKYQGYYALTEDNIDYLVEPKSSPKYDINTENFSLYARDNKNDTLLTIDKNGKFTLFYKTKDRNYNISIDKNGNLNDTDKSLDEKEKAAVNEFLSNYQEQLVIIINRSLDLWNKIN